MAVAPDASAEKKKKKRVLSTSPRRHEVRAAAAEHAAEYAKKMEVMAAKKNGHMGVLPVGCVVHIPMRAVDCGKLDARTVPGVVVEVLLKGEPGSQSHVYRICTKAGVMKSLRVRKHVQVGSKVSPEAVGLDGVFEKWKEGLLAEVTDRKCVRKVSKVGGQGHLHCKCKGNCMFSKCKCFLAGKMCNVRCHKGNTQCENCEDAANDSSDDDMRR